MQKLLIIFLILFDYWQLLAQPSQAQTLNMQINGRYVEIKYVIIPPKPPQKRGKKTVKKDYVDIHIQTRTENDSILRSTYPHKPFTCYLETDDYPYATKGFMEEMLLLLHEGDSAIFWIDANQQYEALNKKQPKFIKPNSKIKTFIKVVQIRNIEEVTRDKDAEIFKIKKKDEEILANYAKENFKGKIFKKTYSGIWYFITKEAEANAEFAKKDDLVSIKYVAKTLDGKIFSSSDNNGGHFELPVGAKFSLPALDEILLLLLKKGASGTFLIPSQMAYKQIGGDGVPPNTCIILEIDFLEITLRKKIYENPLEDERAKLLEKQRKEKEKNKEKEKAERNKKIEKESIKKLQFKNR
jgi:FKBP-type peptidyl-prolyl cis-trans isomerase